MARKGPKAHPRKMALTMVSLFQGEGAEREPPTEFRLFKAGVNKSTKGDFLFDEEAARSVMAEYEAHGVDLSIDYDHAAVNGAGARVVAAGWFKLELRDGDLWATEVKWTPDGAEHLRKGEYRYFSPLFNFDPESGRIQKIVNSALTNTPALHGIDALVAASATATEDPKMEEKLEKALNRIKELEDKLEKKDEEMKALKAKASASALSVTVGLSATASEDDVRGAISGLVTMKTKVLEITGKDSVPAALGMLEGWKSEAADAARLKVEIAERESAALSAELDAVRAEGSKAGKLPPAEDHPIHKTFMALAMSGGKLSKDGIASARTYLETLAPLNKSTQTPTQKSTLALSAVQDSVLAQMSIDRTKFVEAEEKRITGQ